MATSETIAVELWDLGAKMLQVLCRVGQPAKCCSSMIGLLPKRLHMKNGLE